jgi:LmbE family N-acetylglucosaminyl deacetylase
VNNNLDYMMVGEMAAVNTKHVLTRRALLPVAAGAATFAWGQQPANKPKTLLCIGAHMDDTEWMAAGVILKAVHDGLRVVLVQAVSDWSNWPPAQGREKHVEDGVKRIARKMGVEKILLGYKYHHVPVDHELKVRIARIVADIQPDIAIILSENDYWTDHANIARAAKDGIMFVHGYLGRAIRGPRVILAGCTGFNQTFDFRPDTFVDVTPYIEGIASTLTDLDALLTDASPVGATLSLGETTRMPLSHGAERVVAARQVWGEMCGVRFAEAFHAIRRVPSALW